MYIAHFSYSQAELTLGLAPLDYRLDLVCFVERVALVADQRDIARFEEQYNIDHNILVLIKVQFRVEGQSHKHVLLRYDFEKLLTSLTLGAFYFLELFHDLLFDVFLPTLLYQEGRQILKDISCVENIIFSIVLICSHHHDFITSQAKGSLQVLFALEEIEEIPVGFGAEGIHHVLKS